MELVIERVRETSEIFVNGTKAGSTITRQLSWRGDIARLLRPGRNEITVVVTSTGGEAGLLGAVRLVYRPAFPITAWELGSSLEERQAHERGSVQPDEAWREATLEARVPLRRFSTAPVRTAAPLRAFATWYRLEFGPCQDASPLRALLEATGDGLLYLNGHALGRYWQAGPQREFFLPDPWLNRKAGDRNVLTLCLWPVETEARLHNAWVGPYPPRPAE